MSNLDGADLEPAFHTLRNVSRGTPSKSERSLHNARVILFTTLPPPPPPPPPPPCPPPPTLPRSVSYLSDAFDSFETTANTWSTTKGNLPIAEPIDRLYQDRMGILHEVHDRLFLYAVGTIFHVPPPLLQTSATSVKPPPSTPSSTSTATTTPMSTTTTPTEADVATLASELETLRCQIVSTQAATRCIRLETEVVDQELARSTDAAALREVAESRDHPGLLEDAAAVVGLGQRVEAFLARMDALREADWRPQGSAADPAQLERSIRRNMRMVGATASDLKNVSKRLTLPR